MMDAAASMRLFSPSATAETLPDSTPAASFKATSSRLMPTPRRLAELPTWWRTPGCTVSLPPPPISFTRFLPPGSNELQQLPVDQAVRGTDAAAQGIELLSSAARDCTPRFQNHQPACGQIPGLQGELPKAVQPPGGHLTEIQRRRPQGAHPLGSLVHPLELGSVVPAAGGHIIGEPRGQETGKHGLRPGNSQAPAVEKGASPLLRGKAFPPDGIVNHSQDHLAPLHQGQGGAEVRKAVGEVGGAIHGVDHPQIVAGTLPAAPFFG